MRLLLSLFLIVAVSWMVLAAVSESEVGRHKRQYYGGYYGGYYGCGCATYAPCPHGNSGYGGYGRYGGYRGYRGYGGYGGYGGGYGGYGYKK